MFFVVGTCKLQCDTPLLRTLEIREVSIPSQKLDNEIKTEKMK